MANIAYHQYRGLSDLDRTLRLLTRAGFGPLSEPYQAIYKMRGDLLSQLGLRVARPTSLLRLLPGLSPGSVKLWHDAETGWFTEARTEPNARPVYHQVSDDTAHRILRGELSHELETVLMTPDDYAGE